MTAYLLSSGLMEIAGIPVALRLIAVVRISFLTEYPPVWVGIAAIVAQPCIASHLIVKFLSFDH